MERLTNSMTFEKRPEGGMGVVLISGKNAFQKGMGNMCEDIILFVQF